MSEKSVVAEYKEMQERNRALIRGLSSTAEGLDRIVMAVGLAVLEEMLPHVPVDTGTLKASQTLLPDEGVGEAWIFTAARMNPKSKVTADTYVHQAIQKRGDFYTMAAATATEWEEAAFGAFEIWAGELE